jgi:CTP:molybdopterin cytidylyltransferase MocA
MTAPPRPAVSALILAAGAGTRMGTPKALLEFQGELLVERAIGTALAGGCAHAVVVLGAQADEVRQRGDLARAQVVVNQLWPEGMGSSLRAGLAALAHASGVDGIDAALVLLVDQPFVTPAAVRAVIDACRGGARLASASYAGERGHPVLFAREHWPEVTRSAAGDSGGRAFLAARAADLVLVPCDDVADPRDLDTPGDVAAARG